MKKVLPLLLFVLAFVSCIDEEIDYREYNSEINIYLVKDGQIEYYSDNIDLASLDLEKLPWVAFSDIEFYDWSAHVFYLNTEKERGKYSGKYFLVKEGNEALFLGYFISPVSSSISRFPSITAWDNMFYSNDIVKIGGFVNFHREQMDSNVKFKEALISSGLFRAGIQVEMLNIKRKNSSTLEYTIRVTNNSEENVYVLDPNKMGEGRFHYYTNGVSLRKDNVSYYSSGDHISSSEIRSSWYYKLGAHKSMTRSITLNGFTNLPAGNVNYHFSFPGSKADSGEWKKNDGYIWLGDKFIEGEINLN